jgi:hypothetical protein
MKYKLFCNQRHEYRTTFSEEHNWKVTDEIFDNLDDIYEELYNFHEIDYGGMEEEEFKKMTLYDMLDIFEWRIHDANTEEEIDI